MIKGIGHTGLVVANIEKEVAFYRDVIGLTIVQEKNIVAPENGGHTAIPSVHRKLVFMGHPNSEHMLELVCYIDPPSPSGQPLDRHQINSIHISFNVSGLEKLYKDFLTKGVKFLTPPKLTHRKEGGQARICYAQDPEGNWLEFIEEITDA